MTGFRGQRRLPERSVSRGWPGMGHLNHQLTHRSPDHPGQKNVCFLVFQERGVRFSLVHFFWALYLVGLT